MSAQPVQIKADRHCAGCNKFLPKGSKAWTVSTYGQGRRWFCTNCVANLSPKSAKQNINRHCSTYRDIFRTKYRLNSPSFGDEGGVLADQDALSESISDCMECGKCDFAKIAQGIKF